MGYGKMANRYLSQKDLCDRLHGTICRYKDVPVTVTFVTVNTLALTDIVTGELIANIRPTDPDFDISSPEVGYMNFVENGRNYVAFVTRLPLRRYRQGLYQQTCEFRSVDGVTQRSIYGKTYFSMAGFKDSVMGIFPTLGKARSMLRAETADEVALSREVALKKTDSGLYLVYLKTKNIGWIKPDSFEVEMMAGEFDWVAERYLSRLGLDTKEKIVGQPA